MGPERVLRVSVVIPNHNGSEHLEECLNGLAAQSLRDFEVIVVDNASSDDSEQIVRRSSLNVEWVGLEANVGFPGAVNAGIRRAGGEIIAVLNNDTKPGSEWLLRLVAAFDETPSAGFAASKLLRFDPPHLIDAAGDGYWLARAHAVSIGAGLERDSYDRRAWVFGACAAAAAYRRSMLEDIGLFDEEFFFMLEDVDLDLRAQAAGYRCLYVPDAVVLHKRGASYAKDSRELARLYMRNRVWTAIKNLPLPTLVVWCVSLSWRLVVGAAHRARKRDVGTPSTTLVDALDPFVAVAAIADAVRHARRKRAETRHLRRVSAREMRRRLSRDHVPVGPRHRVADAQVS